MANVRAQARRAKGVRTQKGSSTGVALERACSALLSYRLRDLHGRLCFREEPQTN
jgi:hypothetical protein